MSSTIKLRVSKYDPARKRIVSDEDKPNALVGAVKDCHTCITRWTLNRWLSLFGALLLFYSFMLAWMAVHLVGLHATLPDLDWDVNNIKMGAPRNDDFSVDAIHPANKLVRNQIKELKGDQGTAYSWPEEPLDPEPWKQPNKGYYKEKTWGETGSQSDGRDHYKRNSFRRRELWKNYKKPTTYLGNKVYAFKRPNERRNLICWDEPEDDKVKAIFYNNGSLTNDEEERAIWDLVGSDSFKTVQQKPRGCAPPKSTCSAPQQLRVANTWRTKNLPQEIKAQCYMIDENTLPSPNTNGYRYNTEGKKMNGKRFNQQLLSLADVTLSCPTDMDPYAAGRDDGLDTSERSSCSPVTWTDPTTDVGYKYKRCKNGKTVNGTCDNVFEITFERRAKAPHIVQFNVEVTPKGGVANAARLPNMLEAWIECRVVGHHDQDKSPYRFVNNDQPDFWEVPGIMKMQFKYGFDFNKWMDGSMRSRPNDDKPVYPRPQIGSPEDGMAYGLESVEVKREQCGADTPSILGSAATTEAPTEAPGSGDSR